MTHFNIYKASAGSGKTYTLVKEYIKKSISSRDYLPHKSLLAITFTNKAASEMKTRIIDTLFEFSGGVKSIQNPSSKTLFQDLKHELEYSDQELISRSKILLSRIIHYYSLFSVSTIDKFIHKIIRGFTYELDLPSNFEVEMENDRIIQDSIINLFDDLGTDYALTTNLISYSSHKSYEDKHWDIEEDLFKISKQLFKEDIVSVIDNLPNTKIIKKIQIQSFKKIRNYEKKIKAYYSKLQSLVKNIPNEIFIYKDLPNYLDKLKQHPYLDLTISNRLHKSIQNRNWYKKNEKEYFKNLVDQISNQLQFNLQQLIQFIDKEQPLYLFHRQCYNSFFLVGVLGKINQKISYLKREKNIIHISEFNQIILKFLEQSAAPFIYEKIGLKYSHYFIDEFQDTSKIQWNNLVPLVEEALSVGGSCLIVGDGKQSIYRWRGGEVLQFLKLCNNELHNLSHFSNNIKSLKINYRSGNKIVTFNNNFFSFLASHLKPPYNKLYQNLNQKYHHKQKGYVELSMLDKALKDVVDETLKEVYSKIKSSQDDNYSFSDIILLTRSNKEINTIAHYLTEKGIPIISSESLLLKNSKTVEFLINNLAVILDESDYLSKAKLLEYLISQQILKIETCNIHQFISTSSKVSNLQFEKLLNNHNINFRLKDLLCLNVFELVEQLVRIYNIDNKVNLYIIFFLDFVFEFAVKETNTVSQFLQYWNQKKNLASIIIPSGMNAVEIMTIHKSKGLQFPIVIFPFANWKEDLGKEKRWFDVSSFFSHKGLKNKLFNLLPLKKEIKNWPILFQQAYFNHQEDVILDNINLLYVAMTRPKERLYIISNSDPKKGNIYKYFENFIIQSKLLKSTHNIFYTGEKTKKVCKNQLIENIDTSEFISNSWRSRIRIKRKKYFNKILKQKYSINWGDLIHEIMADINSKDDINFVLKKMLIKKKYGTSNFNRMKLEIERIVSDVRISHLFNKKLSTFSEKSILSTDGTVYRPDRVIDHKNHFATLIDYKTGDELNSHIYQMEKYESILYQIGFKKIDKYLIYLTTGKIKKL
ncbi:MAG: hypothetical protein CMP49_01365 [Flavobacteriales bacterium]|nr:hypothetical protein [Flavobacteriales bacterium]|tara:strand:- start:12485 stop:15607 length:3123 start_codon:yes stop_codon:yes gene_type:complete